MAAPRAAAGPAGRAPAPTPALARLAPALLSLLLLAAGPVSVFGKGPRLKISKCDGHEMAIEVPLPDSGSSVYLQHLKSFSELACQPEIVDGVARFRLPLDNVFQCGITRVTNQQTGTRTYWARVVLEAEQGGDQEVLSAKCTVPGPGAAAGADADAEADESVNIAPAPAPTPTPALAVNRTRRNVLPAGFQEEEVLEVRPVEKTVQAPQLGVEVRQGGQPVTGELNVNPGTPLTMEIFLDKVAAPIYGLLVSHMTVSDTKAQEETIVFNGCSVDPYLFDNFNTVDGDFLSAKFRAFKFPESSFVQFRGTVTVCLGKCRGVECSNGVVGYGRKRRAVASLPPDPNKVFEVALSAFIKVDYENEEDQAMEKALLAARSDAPAAAESGNILGTVPAASSGMEVAREELPGFTVLQSQSQAIILSSMPLLLLTTILLALLRH